jgi:hypothetical protein
MIPSSKLPFVPFFVADRPMSLRILKGLRLLQDYPDVHIGIMAHANTSRNFQEALRKYPCENLEYCDAVGGACKYPGEEIDNCPFRKHILSHTVKMCDSGMFTREGATLTYEQLFEAYERMDVKYGIMIDVFQDAQATLNSAKEAKQVYETGKYKFQLVAVAQGKTPDEYIECYEKLKDLGFTHIAVGGLLRRTENTVRYVTIRSQELMFDVLGQLHQRYDNDWLFALGCFHPKRLEKLRHLKVWADYKGWIFQYKKTNETLSIHIKDLVSNYSENLDNQEFTASITALQDIITRRNNLMAEQKKLSQQLHEGRRTLRADLSYLHQKCLEYMPEIASRFKKLTTFGLLQENDKRIVNKVLLNLKLQDSEWASVILKNIDSNRQLSLQIETLEKKLNQINSSLVKQLDRLTLNDTQLSEEVKYLFADISQLVEMEEREHRLTQVRNQICEKILKPLLAKSGGK